MFNHEGYITLPLAGTLAKGTAVTINSSGQWAAAAQAAASRPVGILMDGGVANDYVVAYCPKGKVESIGASTLTNDTFAVGEVVYTAASGVLTNISTSATALGVCIKAGAEDKQFEWVPFI